MLVKLPQVPLSSPQLLWQSLRLLLMMLRRGWGLLLAWLGLALVSQFMVVPLWVLLFGKPHYAIVSILLNLLQLVLFAWMLVYALHCTETDTPPPLKPGFKRALHYTLSLWIATAIAGAMVFVGYRLAVLPGVWLAVVFSLAWPRIVIYQLPLLEALFGCFAWSWGNWFYCLRALIGPVVGVVVVMGWLDHLLHWPLASGWVLWFKLLAQCLFFPWLAAVMVLLCQVLELERLRKKQLKKGSE